MIIHCKTLRLASPRVSKRCIATPCRFACSTAQITILRVKRRNLAWPLPEDMGDKTIYSILFLPNSAVYLGRVY